MADYTSSQIKKFNRKHPDHPISTDEKKILLENSHLFSAIEDNGLYKYLGAGEATVEQLSHLNTDTLTLLGNPDVKAAILHKQLSVDQVGQLEPNALSKAKEFLQKGDMDGFTAFVKSQTKETGPHTENIPARHEHYDVVTLKPLDTPASKAARTQVPKIV